MDRRSFFGGVAAFLAAPAIIRVAQLMPLSVQEPFIALPTLSDVPTRILTPSDVTREALRVLHKRLNFVGAMNLEYDTSMVDGPLTIRLPAQYTVRTDVR